jgi:hypothetical protein
MSMSGTRTRQLPVFPHKAFAGVPHKAFASIRRNQVTSVPSHLVYSSVKENETMKPPL